MLRYERSAPEELLYMDTMQFERIVRPGHRITSERRGFAVGAGWKFSHLLIAHEQVSCRNACRELRFEGRLPICCLG